MRRNGVGIGHAYHGQHGEYQQRHTQRKGNGKHYLRLASLLVSRGLSDNRLISRLAHGYGDIALGDKRLVVCDSRLTACEIDRYALGARQRPQGLLRGGRTDDARHALYLEIKSLHLTPSLALTNTY